MSWISTGHPRGDGGGAMVDSARGVERSDENPSAAECGEFQSLGRFESLMMMKMMGIWKGAGLGRKVREWSFCRKWIGGDVG